MSEIIADIMIDGRYLHDGQSDVLLRILVNEPVQPGADYSIEVADTDDNQADTFFISKEQARLIAVALNNAASKCEELAKQAAETLKA